MEFVVRIFCPTDKFLLYTSFWLETPGENQHTVDDDDDDDVSVVVVVVVIVLVFFFFVSVFTATKYIKINTHCETSRGPQNLFLNLLGAGRE